MVANDKHGEIKTAVKDGRLIRAGSPGSVDWLPIVERAFAQIGWKLQNAGAGHYYIKDHKGRSTHWMFYADRLEHEWESRNKEGHRSLSASVTACFYLKVCKFELLDDDCLCLAVRDSGPVEKRNGSGTTDAFVLFHKFQYDEEEE